MEEKKALNKLIKKITKRFSKIKFSNVEISPEAIGKEVLPSATSEESKDYASYLLDLISGKYVNLRSLNNNRFIRYRDYEEMCLTGDTKISLLNNCSIELSEWYKKAKDDYLFVYSFDLQKQIITYGIAYNIHIARENVEIYEVFLNNGESFKATGDHKVLLEDNTYKEVSQLQKGDKIKSLARKIETSSNYRGYEKVYIHKDKKYYYTHKLILSSLLGLDYKKLCNVQKEKNKRKDIHHKNKKFLDNRPTNLILLSKYKHKKIHDDFNFLKKNNYYLFEIDKNRNYYKLNLQPTFRNPYEVIEVTDIKILPQKETVYDFSVYPNKNFALDCGIFVHNCDDPLIDGAIDTYTYELIKKNEKNECLEIISNPNTPSNIIKSLKLFFFNKLNIETLLKKIIRDLLVYGDCFYEIIFNKNISDVLYLKNVSPYKMFRVEENERLKYFKYIKNVEPNIFRTHTYKMYYPIEEESEGEKIPSWRILHFRLEDNLYNPYGRSILDSCRVTWRQIKLLEDAMVIYRLVRAPQRRVWKIGTGQLAPDKALEFVNKIKNSFRKKDIVNPLTGEITQQTKAQSMLEDYWIPVPKGDTATSVEVLDTGGPAKFSDIDDVLYFRQKIITFKLGLPEAWLKGEYRTSGKSLAFLDAQFAERIQTIQTFIEKQLNKLAFIYLFIKGIDIKKFKDIRIKLVSPSYYSEGAKYEFLNTKLSYISNLKNLGLYPNVYILKKFLGHSTEEIIEILSLLAAEQQGGDIISLLTGKPATLQQSPSPELEKEFEKKLGKPPEGTEQPSPELITTIPTTEIPTETEKEKLSPEKEAKEKVLTPTELALKALLNLESLKERDNKDLLEESSSESYLLNLLISGEINLLDLKNKKNSKIIGDEKGIILEKNFVDFLKQLEKEKNKDYKQQIKLLENKIKNKETKI